MTKKTYNVESRIKFEGKRHEPGSTVEMEEKDAQKLLKSGELSVPKKSEQKPQTGGNTGNKDKDYIPDAVAGELEKLVAGKVGEIQVLIPKLSDGDLLKLQELETAGDKRSTLLASIETEIAKRK